MTDGSRFHIYWNNKNSGTSGTDYVELDLDDVTSYGPETTTIYQQIDGVYRFFVHDYTNRASSSNTALSNSGATVRVIRYGNSTITTFNVPVNQGGTLWTVFDLNGDTITPINTMSYESTSADITYDPAGSSSFAGTWKMITLLGVDVEAQNLVVTFTDTTYTFSGGCFSLSGGGTYTVSGNQVTFTATSGLGECNGIFPNPFYPSTYSISGTTLTFKDVGYYDYEWVFRQQ